MRGAGLIAVPNLTIHIFRGHFEELVDAVRTRNKFLSWGRANLRNLMGYPALPAASSTTDPPSGGTPRYLAIGTNAGAVSDTDTGCQDETFRKEITRRIPSVDGSGNESIRLQTFIGNGEANGVTLTEASLETVDVGGSLPTGEIGAWTRAVYTGIAKTSAISIIFDWEIGFAST